MNANQAGEEGEKQDANEEIENQSGNEEKSEDQVCSMIVVTIVACYITHSIGGSCFYLPYALSISGIFAFIFILGFIAVTTSFALIFMREMSPKDSNYFDSIEDKLPSFIKNLKVIRILYIIDVIVCTALYHKFLPLIAESTFLDESAEPRTVIILQVVCYIFTAVVPLIIEKKWKYDGSKQRNSGTLVQINSQTNIKNSLIQKLEAPAAPDVQHEEERNAVNMDGVSKEMSNLHSKREILLFIFMLMILVQIIFCFYFNENKVMENLEHTAKESGFGLISVALSIVMFSFMNYAILLPVYPGENGLPEDEYIKMAVTAKSGLTLIYAVFGLSVYLTFGGSVTSNLLLIIFPSLAYLKFRWSGEGHQIKFIAAMLVLIFHCVLLLAIADTLLVADPAANQGMRHLAEQHWASNKSNSCHV